MVVFLRRQLSIKMNRKVKQLPRVHKVRKKIRKLNQKERKKATQKMNRTQQLSTKKLNHMFSNGKPLHQTDKFTYKIRQLKSMKKSINYD